MSKQLHPEPAGGGNAPADKATAPKPEQPAAASLVLDGKKSEREIQLEQENAELQASNRRLTEAKKKVETDHAHLADENQRLKAVIHPQPAAAPAAAPGKAKGGWTFFG